MALVAKALAAEAFGVRSVFVERAAKGHVEGTPRFGAAFWSHLKSQLCPLNRENVEWR